MKVVLACRGCCCGTQKHPDTDHDGQLYALQAAVGDLLKVTSCLGECRWSNLVVAIDPATGEQNWFGRVLTQADTASLIEWLGDPESRPLPRRLVRIPDAGDRERALGNSWYRSQVAQ